MKTIYNFLLSIILFSTLLLSGCNLSGSKIASQKEILIMKFDPLLNVESGLSNVSYGIITGSDIYFYIDASISRSALIPTIFYNGGMIKFSSIREGLIVQSAVTPLDFSSNESPLFVIAENTSHRTYNCRIVDNPSLLPKISIPASDNDNELVYISGGSFKMGSSVLSIAQPDSVPEHQVDLSPFFISEFEVSSGEFAEVMNWAHSGSLVTVDPTKGTVSAAVSGKSWLLFDYSPSQSHLVYVDQSGIECEEGFESYPVINVTWYGAQFFCYFLNLKEGLDSPYNPLNDSLDLSANGYRVPTEAEWEFAARRDPDGIVSAGNLISRVDDAQSDDQYCLYQANSPSSSLTTRGSLSPNKMALYDMSGSAKEWVWDGYELYSVGTFNNPLGDSDSLETVLRGGSYLSASIENCYTSVRKRLNKEGTYVDIGYRVVRSSFEGSK